MHFLHLINKKPNLIKDRFLHLHLLLTDMYIIVFKAPNYLPNGKV